MFEHAKDIYDKIKRNFGLEDKGVAGIDAKIEVLDSGFRHNGEVKVNNKNKGRILNGN